MKNFTFIVALISAALLVGCGKRERELEKQIVELQMKQAEELEQLKAEVDRLSGMFRISQEKHEKTQEELGALHASLGVKWSELFKEVSDLSEMRDRANAQLETYQVYRQERAARIARGEKVETKITICPDDTMIEIPREIEKFETKIAEKKAVLEEIEKTRAHLKTIIDSD